jgi:hypothetical protein
MSPPPLLLFAHPFGSARLEFKRIAMMRKEGTAKVERDSRYNKKHSMHNAKRTRGRGDYL